MSHLARAADYLDCVQAALDDAKTVHEAPTPFIEAMQVFLHDAWILLDGAANRRWTYDQPEET